MAYEKQTWECGDVISAEKMNHMEDGIADAGGGDPGYECTETTTVVFEGDISTTSQFTQFTPLVVPTSEMLFVTVDGAEYELPKNEVSGGCVYGEVDSQGGPVFNNYPYAVYFGTGGFASFLVETSGSYQVKMEGKTTVATVSDCFRKAVNYATGSIPKNVVDGSAQGSVRTISSKQEDDNYTMGINAFAEGYYTTARGASSHAEGDSTAASGRSSHAEGDHTTASENFSHAEGNYTTASGDCSHAEGYYAAASGRSSHAEGDHTTASGYYSHAEGNHTTASGYYSHAEGEYTTASEGHSHAEGYYTTASGGESHAEGDHTTANHKSQHVFGEYNVEDPSTADAYDRGTYVEIVGNGTSNSKSNARTLDWGGNESLQGSLTLGEGTADETTITAAQLKALLATLA